MLPLKVGLLVGGVDSVTCQSVKVFTRGGGGGGGGGVPSVSERGEPVSFTDVWCNAVLFAVFRVQSSACYCGVQRLECWISQI